MANIFKHRVACLFFILVGIVCWLFWPLQRISVQESGSKSICLLPANTFTLQWKHSVEHQWWREEYVLIDRHLLLERTYFQTFGAGVPADGNEIVAPEGFVGRMVKLSLPSLDWVVSPNMQGSMISDGLEWPVYRYVAPYTTLHITPYTATRIQILFGKLCYEAQSKSL